MDSKIVTVVLFWNQLKHIVLKIRKLIEKHCYSWMANVAYIICTERLIADLDIWLSLITEYTGVGGSMIRQVVSLHINFIK